MLEIDNQTDKIIDIERLLNVYDSLSKRDLELIFVDNKTIKGINKKFRGKNYPTDVLSFPLEDTPYSPLGSIMISVDEALKASKEFKHSFDDEVLLLFIHGFLHIVGFDHELDNGQMRQEEQRLIQKFNLPKSLIIRSLE